ncbi:MAG: hypothetical protein NT007_14730 [Candidatus Kapabacteria bacterium]|nr:hypothetical protein [Candidatus Kapabacteria bacterium]
MPLQILNYVARSIVLIVGIMILCGYIAPPNFDFSYRILFGTMVTMFGIFRLVNYYMRNKKLQLSDEDDNE